MNVYMDNMDNNLSIDNFIDSARSADCVVSEKTKIICCLLESFVSIIFITCCFLFFLGLIPIPLNPIGGWLCVIGTGILQSDLIVRAIFGVGFVW